MRFKEDITKMLMLKYYMTNDEMLRYFLKEYEIAWDCTELLDHLIDAVRGERYLAEQVEAYEYCQRLVDFEDWCFEKL